MRLPMLAVVVTAFLVLSTIACKGTGSKPSSDATPTTTVAQETTPEPQAPETEPLEITEEQLIAIATAFIEQFPLTGYELDESRTGVESNDDWIAESLNLKEAPKFLAEHGRTTGRRLEYLSFSNSTYQIRVSLSAFSTSDGARGYLDNLVPYLEGGIGTPSRHEGTLQAAQLFTPNVVIGDSSVGVTLEFDDQSASYYQTYVGFTEGALRTSVSLFTTPEPDDNVRRQAEELLAILRPIILHVLGS